MKIYDTSINATNIITESILFYDTRIHENDVFK